MPARHDRDPAQPSFNWAIWPDFSEIPSPEAPFLRSEEIEVGKTISLSGRDITPIRRAHRAGGR